MCNQKIKRSDAESFNSYYEYFHSYYLKDKKHSKQKSPDLNPFISERSTRESLKATLSSTVRCRPALHKWAEIYSAIFLLAKSLCGSTLEQNMPKYKGIREIKWCFEIVYRESILYKEWISCHTAAASYSKEMESGIKITNINAFTFFLQKAHIASACCF